MAMIANIAIAAAALTSIGTTIAQVVDQPKRPPSVPNPRDKEVTEAQARARKLAEMRGRRGTTLASSRGLADDTLVGDRPRLLGESAA